MFSSLVGLAKLGGSNRVGIDFDECLCVKKKKLAPVLSFILRSIRPQVLTGVFHPQEREVRG